MPTPTRTTRTIRRNVAVATLLAFAGIVSMAALAPAQAADDSYKEKQLEKHFKAADKDHDGKLTRAEAEAGMPRVAKNFDQIDKDKKGYVTLDDIKQAMQKAQR